MFTGIVQEMGRVVGIEDRSGLRALVIEADAAEEVAPGGSIAVAGVCLTAVTAGDGRVRVEVVPETLRRSNLGGLDVGDPVNVELAMPAGGRFDGHVVQGHVDGVGVVESIEDGSGGVVMQIEAPAELMPYIVDKGSITVEGVSLTVAGLGGSGFSVALIPHTLDVTTLGSLSRGDAVNLEVDVLAKYVERLIEARA